MDEDYYVPVTIQQFVDVLQEYVDDPKVELSGDELIIGAQFIHDDDQDVPQNSIVLTLKRAIDDPDDAQFGIVCVGPAKPRFLM